MITAQLHLIHESGTALNVDSDDAGPPRCRTDDTATLLRQHDPKHQSCGQDAPTGSHARSLDSGPAVREQRYGDDVFQLITYRRRAARIAP